MISFNLYPFIEDKKSRFFKSYFFIITFFTFLILRIPLLENHFFHCDDNPRLLTYPVFSHLIGSFFWWLSEVFHYKLFLKTPAFVFENFFTRAFSLFMSLLSLWSLLLVSKKIFRNNNITFFLGIIYCCSQMSIIYSVHSSPYGYSILPINLMLLYILYFDKSNFYSNRFLAIFLIIIIPYLSIFAIFLIPAFILTLLINTYSSQKEFKKIIRLNLITSILLLINSLLVIVFQVIPMKNKISDRALALNWNTGIKDQFLFNKGSILELFLNPLETIVFYFRNLILILENNISPLNFIADIPINKLAMFSSFILCPIILVGVYKLRKINNKVLMFAAFCITSFFVLVYFNFLTLSPTRHNLWILTFTLILIAASATILSNRVVNILALIILLSSALSYKNFFESRKAKITYLSLKEMETKYDIDFFINYTSSSNSWFPNSTNVSKNFLKKNFKILKSQLHKNNFKEINCCLISHRPVDNLSSNKEIKKLISFKKLLELNKLKDNVLKEDLIYENYVFSNTEIGRSGFCSNGTNGVFVKIIKVYFK